MRDLFTTNLGYKALALAFALMMWVWVQSEQVVEERARVRLAWQLPDGLTLLEPPLETATVTVEGIQAFVRQVRQKDLSIAIDLSRAQEGEVTLDLGERPVNGLPGQVRVVSMSPSTLKVQLDRVLKRKVDVVPDTLGEPAEGYRIAEVTVKPARVELSGPSSALKGLGEVRTDAVDLSGLREDAEFVVGLAVKKGQLAPTQAKRFVVAVRVEPVPGERVLEAVPVEIEGVEGFAVEGGVQVTLAGPSDKLAAIDAGEVRVRVRLPDGWAEEKAEATRGAADGPSYEVVHPGGELVSVVDVLPARITVSRQ
jgi:YbbR domain-containing protein